MILNDKQIYELCLDVSCPMIAPCMSKLVRAVGEGTAERKVVSYGLSSCGYDIRLDDKSIRVFRHIPGKVVDPKKFDDNFLGNAVRFTSALGKGCILPAHTYVLCVSMEKFCIPDNIRGRVEGKSTYARCGIGVNVTPLEPGWVGYLTLEIHNSSDSDVCIYTEEGIAQIEFATIDRPEVTYGDRKGKYQNQQDEIVLPRV
jgi:dCTP deaminase